MIAAIREYKVKTNTQLFAYYGMVDTKVWTIRQIKKKEIKQYSQHWSNLRPSQLLCQNGM